MSLQIHMRNSLFNWLSLIKKKFMSSETVLCFYMWVSYYHGSCCEFACVFSVHACLYKCLFGALMNYPCLFCPSDNFENCFALPTRWRASVCALFYCYLTFLDHRINIRRKVRAPRRVSVSGASKKFQNCHLDETNLYRYVNQGCFALFILCIGTLSTLCMFTVIF